MPTAFALERDRRLAAAARSLSKVSTENEFLRWTANGLSDLLPHASFICGLGVITPAGIEVHQLLSRNFPMGYLRHFRREGKLLTPTMARWCTEESPQLFEPDTARHMDSASRAVFDRHRLHNIAAHGVRDVHGASYFSFHRIPERLTGHHAEMLWLLAPHMHIALRRISSSVSPPRADSAMPVELISSREKQILHLIALGHTDREIASKLCRSPNTVAHHVEHILAKLDSRNRAHAIYKAVELGILQSATH